MWHDRRAFLLLAGGGAVCGLAGGALARTPDERERHFLAEAFRMRREAVARGDQPFGAVVVRAGEIVGYGPSRVVIDRNPDSHAERVALWDAQRRLGRDDVAGAVIYSTSRPCVICQSALASAGVERMVFGEAGEDAGRPRRRP